MSPYDTYIGVGLIAVSAITILWLALKRPSFPDQPDEPADDSVQDGPPCMVTHPNRCPNTATHNDWGWLTCDTHAPRRAA